MGTSIDFNEIVDIQDVFKKLKARKFSEEDVKHFGITPLLRVLHYPVDDPTKTIFEYDAGINVSNETSGRNPGVDYAFLVNNQPLVLVEVKKPGKSLQYHKKQLSDYYNYCPAQLGMLINGDEVWMYTDSVKINVMDREPFDKFKISELTEDDLEEFQKYTYERAQTENYRGYGEIIKCKEAFREFITDFNNGKFSMDFIKWFAENTGIQNLKNSEIAGIASDVSSNIKETERERMDDEITANVVNIMNGGYTGVETPIDGPEWHKKAGQKKHMTFMGEQTVGTAYSLLQKVIECICKYYPNAEDKLSKLSTVAYITDVLAKKKFGKENEDGQVYSVNRTNLAICAAGRCAKLYQKDIKKALDMFGIDYSECKVHNCY